MTLPIQGARRVMETTDPDTVNQYLRFGWKLINQYVVQSRSDALPVVNYVLASVRTLEETKELVTLTDTDEVNAYLALGWRLLDKYVSGEIEGPRHESLHFVLAWQQRGSAGQTRVAKPPRPSASWPGIWRSKSSWIATEAGSVAL